MIIPQGKVITQEKARDVGRSVLGAVHETSALRLRRTGLIDDCFRHDEREHAVIGSWPSGTCLVLVHRPSLGQCLIQGRTSDICILSYAV